MKKIIPLIGALSFLPAFAQAEDSWEVQVGFNRIDPQVDSGDLSAPSLPGTKIDVDYADSAILTVRYALNEDMGLVFFAGLPYRHDVMGAGAVAGVGKIGDTRQISPTVILQRRFTLPEWKLRPFIGAGLTYSYFYDERGSNILTSMTNPGGEPTEMEIDDAFGISFQAGIEYDVTEHWFASAGVIKTFIGTTSTLSTGQKITTDLNPLSSNVTVGYRF